MEITPALKTFGETFGGTVEVTVHPDTKQGTAILIIGVHAVRVRSGEELYDKIAKSISKKTSEYEKLVARVIFEKLTKQAYREYENWLLKRIAENENIEVRITAEGYKILYKEKLVCNSTVSTENYRPQKALKVCSQLAQERLHDIYSGQDLITLHVINNIEKHIF